MTIRLFTCMAAALLIAGCATAPVALEEAHHGLSLSTQLKQELAVYAARQAALDDMRKQQLGENIRTSQERLLDLPGDDQLYAFSGQDKRLSAIKQLRSRAALLAAAAAAKEAGAKHLEDLIGQLATPLPPVGEALGATGKAFGALGKELPFAERAALAASFLGEVREEVKKNQQAATSTAAAAAKEPAGSVIAPATPAAGPSTVK